MRRLLPALLIVLLSACANSGQRANETREEAGERRAAAARTNVSLASGYFNQGNTEVALEKVQRALEFDSSSPEAHTLAGIIYERIGNEADARKHYRRAVQLDGESGQALNNYGVFLCKAGEVEEGVNHLVRAVRDPFYATPAAALTNAGVCWEGDGDVEQAELFYRQSLEVDPAFGDALFLMARLLLAKGDAFRARAFLQRYESAAAPLPESLELGIEIERALDNQEGIQQYEDRLKRLFPDAGRRPGSQNSE